jgi:fructan beta-fructosidase
MRPGFHFTPPQNWLNDPNGLVYHAGEYHLFYQHHPYSDTWGPMHWGHAVSRDLLHWENLPIALSPDENGMIFSGSAVVDRCNTAGFGPEALVALFTCHKEPGHLETQNLACSRDNGRTWQKYPGNPLLPNPGLRDFRDPKVFWHLDHWVMCLAAGQSILFYASKNLKHWKQTGSFGPEYCPRTAVWETPDMFELPVAGLSGTRWALTLGVSAGGPAGGSASQYIIGHFDGCTFIPETPPHTPLWMDYGPDFYAPQSWNDEPDGRRILLGWMTNWRYAARVPSAGWRGSMSIPREIGLVNTSHGIRLTQTPIPTLDFLRQPIFHVENLLLTPGHNPLQALRGDCLDLLLKVNLPAPVFGLRLRVGSDEQTVITCNPSAQTLAVDRTRSGAVDFHEAFAAVHIAPLPAAGDSLQIRILLDGGSLEIFTQQGQLALTETIFPCSTSLGLEIFTSSVLDIQKLTIFAIRPKTMDDNPDYRPLSTLASSGS